jgi:Phage capsid family.
MKFKNLVGLNTDALKARLKEINVLAETAEGSELDALQEEVDEINGKIDDIDKRAKIAGAAMSAEANPSSPGEGVGETEPKNKARAASGAKLKGGETVNYNAKTVVNVQNVLTSEQTVLPAHTAKDVKDTFNDVSSLVDRVNAINLNGGESYKRGYVVSYGDGAGETAENADYNLTEPKFAYAQITKQKITAYTEEPEEMVKLPNADYDVIVEGSVSKAVRRYMSRQILIGDGATGHFTGIFHNPANATDGIIDRNTDISVKEITNATLDEIIYSFGGDEEVEDVAVLVLNKKDLKKFAMLRDKQDRKVYTIVNHGNTGTIDSVPYVLNVACGVVSAPQTAADVYCMAYGPLSNYELAIFSDLDARKSTEYKFKQGQIAYRADIFAGGNVAARNGFIRVKRPKKTT